MAKPLDTSMRAAFASRDAGASRGAVSGWRGPRVRSEAQAAAERRLEQQRAADLAGNDWAAESALSAITQNAIGTGLVPTAQLPAERLGISAEDSRKIGKSMEWEFWRWGRSADVTGRQTFEEMQFLGLRTMLAQGELLHLPVMLSESDRKSSALPFGLAIQAVSPSRLRTPSAFEGRHDIHDGIRFNAFGRPVEYFIASPASDGSSTTESNESSMAFTAIPASTAHRPSVLHLFAKSEDEQIRGHSIFSNSAGLFRLLDDSLSNELATQVAAGKFAIWVNRDATLSSVMPAGVESDEGQFYTSIDGVNVVYGNEGEKPQILENGRPSQNFLAFVKVILNAIASSVGIPYIALAKDFSEVNYSSARAAMNEAWRVFRWYRRFFAERYCQPVYAMVIEEAFLRGYIKLPCTVSQFYEQRDLWTSAAWNGPARGYMDPTREVQADILSIQHHLATRHEVMASAGRDFDDDIPVMIAELDAMSKLASEPLNANRPAQTDTAAGITEGGKKDDTDE